MKASELSSVMRDLDVAMSLFESLQYILEHNACVKDFHYLACLAGEGKRKLDSVVDTLSDL